MRRIYVGPKQTTIENSDFFDGSITLIGDNENGNVAYSNEPTFHFWNPDNNELEIDIYNKAIARIKEPTEIMAHNPNLISHCILSNNVKLICKNAQEILDVLDNKIATYNLMKDTVPMLDYKLIKGSDFKLTENFVDLVIQHPVGSGGAKTFLCRRESFNEIRSILLPNDTYFVSEYKHNNSSYNIHCVIGKKQIELFTPSQQILEIKKPWTPNTIEYIGNNFNVIIPQEIKYKLVDYSTMICKKLQGLGYRGVLGIDYIHADAELYFIEVNPRFQGSTRQVDALLKQSDLPSIFEYNYIAFLEEQMPSAKNMKGNIK